jgi:hypothetical protein
MVIGIRSHTDGFSYVILDGSQDIPICIVKQICNLPVGDRWGESLSWVRRQIDEICNNYRIVNACIKIIEHNARRKSTERIQIEAIMIEYFNSVRHVSCETRVKSQIKRAIPGFAEPARYLDRVIASHNSLDELNSPAYQEAAIAAISILRPS